jgi:hypothetical protein
MKKRLQKTKDTYHILTLCGSRLLFLFLSFVYDVSKPLYIYLSKIMHLRFSASYVFIVCANHLILCNGIKLKVIVQI